MIVFLAQVNGVRPIPASSESFMTGRSIGPGASPASIGRVRGRGRTPGMDTAECVAPKPRMFVPDQRPCPRSHRVIVIQKMTRAKILALFDVDGTLSDPRKAATPDMLAFMQELKKVRWGCTRDLLNSRIAGARGFMWRSDPTSSPISMRTAHLTSSPPLTSPVPSACDGGHRGRIGSPQDRRAAGGRL